MAAQVAAHHHLHLHRFSAAADDHARIGRSDGPVRCGLSRGFEHVPAHLAQHLSLVGDTARQHDIKGADAVAGEQDGTAIAQVVHIADFAAVHFYNVLQVEVGTDERVGEGDGHG